MRKILGLDLGVSSIGWAFIERDKANNQGKILGAGVRIVPLSTPEADEFGKGNAISTNRSRTMKRGARRGIQRYKLRRTRLLSRLRHLGWIENETPIQTDRSLEIYGLRAKAAIEQVAPSELATVFLSLNSKRGYQSNRKAQNEDEEGTDYLEKIRERDRELIERNITIGQKHYEMLMDNPWATLKKRIYSRKSYLAEFDQIWNTQKQFHPELTDKLYLEIGPRTIFYQRPLRSQKGLISKCTLEPQKRVAPKSSPVFQVFKIWQQIHNLEVNDEAGKDYPLNIDKKKMLFTELDSKGKMSLTQFKKLLGYASKEPILINFPHLEGNYTKASLLKVLEDTGYDTHEILDLDLSLEGNQFDKQPFMQLWHLLYSSIDQESLIKNLMLQFGFDETQALALAKVRLVQDYGSLSVRAMRKILPFMEEGLTYDKAAVKANYNHSFSETKEEKEEKVLQQKLPVIQKGKLRNPVVEKILNQLVHLVNDILSHPEMGQPDEIRVELARELKASAKQRKNATKVIQDNARNNERIKERLVSEFGLRNISRNDILKLKLLEETDCKSLYTGKPISPVKLFTTDEYDIDHIIPQSRLFDDSMTNKVLCESYINREKGNLTAWDYIQSKGDDEVRRFLQDVQSCSKLSLSKKKKLRMAIDEIPDDFISRQLKESQYIVKEAMAMLGLVCRDVTSTTGIITSFLRNEWGLAHVMQELNEERYAALGKVSYRELASGKRILKIEDWSKRDDHRHHAVDALVVAATSQSIIQELNTLNERFEGLNQVNKEKLKFSVPWNTFRNDAINAFQSILISFKGKNKVATWNRNRTKKKGKGNYNFQRVLTPRGQLHKETIYGTKRWYEQTPVPLNKKFIRPDLIIDVSLRALVVARWALHGNDPVKAAASLTKDPILIDGKPLTEVKCWKEFNTIRKQIDDKLNLNKVFDRSTYNLLMERLNEYGGDKKKAFSDLDKNPILLNGIPVRYVTLEEKGSMNALHHNGNEPINYVFTQNNHHAAIFLSPEGMRQLEMVSFFEAVERKRMGLSVFSEHNEEGWPLEFTLQINDYFLFDIDPSEMDIYDPKNRNMLSKHLYRVQKLSGTDSGSPYFVFRHHLETTLKNEDSYAFRSVRSFGKLTGTKVVLDRLGHILPS